MEKYEGFNIPEKIIVVSSPIVDWRQGKRVNTGRYAGYVVIPGKKDMLENALHWAGCKYDYVDGKLVYKDYDKYVHEFNNGEFALEIIDSANNSYQGGKLSFWTCKIWTDEKHIYEIGINADLLCNLIRQNVLDNGVCSKNIWLGRQKGNRVGAFTENMSEFKQAQADAIVREKKASVKYDPGQIVYNKKGDKFIYLGEVYERCFMYDHAKMNNGWYGGTEHYYVLRNTPVKKYAYLSVGHFKYWTVEDKKKPYLFDEGDVIELTDKHSLIYLIEHDFDNRDMTEYAKANMAYNLLRYSIKPDRLESSTEIHKVFDDYLNHCKCYHIDKQVGTKEITEERLKELEGN